MSEEMSKKLHQQAQERLAQYLLKKSLNHNTEQHREALLAQVHTDVDQLMSKYPFHFLDLRLSFHISFDDAEC